MTPYRGWRPFVDRIVSQVPEELRADVHASIRLNDHGGGDGIVSFPIWLGDNIGETGEHAVNDLDNPESPLLVQAADAIALQIPMHREMNPLWVEIRDAVAALMNEAVANKPGMIEASRITLVPRDIPGNRPCLKFSLSHLGHMLQMERVEQAIYLDITSKNLQRDICKSVERIISQALVKALPRKRVLDEHHGFCIGETACRILDRWIADRPQSRLDLEQMKSPAGQPLVVDGHGVFRATVKDGRFCLRGEAPLQPDGMISIGNDKVKIKMEVPDTVLLSMNGRRLEEVVTHPLLPNDVLITKAVRSSGRIELCYEDRTRSAARYMSI